MLSKSLAVAIRLFFLVSCITAASLPLGARGSAASSGTFNNNTVFQSPSGYTVPGTLYARTVELPDGTLLATWENYSPEPPQVYFPIYSSSNGGATWSPLSEVHDQVNGWGLRYQPFLYLLPRAFGGFPAHTILLAGSSIPTDLSQTQIELYASTDSGKTWKFVSHIAHGGRAIPNNGETPVWEPFLMLHDDVLVCYYSDQRDPAHGQKLVHQTTTDLRTWGAVVDDVAYSTYTARPGMPVVARMGEGGNFVMTYEYGGGPVNGDSSGPYSFPVYYKIAADPLKFGDVQGQPVVTAAGGVVPVSSPYVIWDAQEEMLIVSCGTLGDVFVNKAHGDVHKWEARQTHERVSYTRSLRLLKKAGKQKLLLAGGGMLPPSQNNSVAVGVISTEGW